MKRVFFAVIIFGAAVSACFAEDKPPENTGYISVHTAPAGYLPLGSSGEIFKMGAGLGVTGSFSLPGLRIFGFEFGSRFTLFPIDTANSLGTLAGFAGPAVWLPLGKRFAFLADGTVGYYYWMPFGWDAAAANGGGLFVSGGGSLLFRFTDSFSIGAGASYDYFFNLYNGLRFEIAVRFDFPYRTGTGTGTGTEQVETFKRPEQLKKAEAQLPGGGAEGAVEITEFNLNPVFPVLYKYYDSNPVGTVVIKNSGPVPAENIKLSFFVERYMDNPMDAPVIAALSPDEEKEAKIFGLFTEDLMQITEGTKASSKITLSYSVAGEEKLEIYTPVLEFYNRNALTWDDDRKVSAFVTAKDPEIMGFAKKVLNWVQDDVNPALDENFQKGMAVFEALKAYGIRYEVDPATPFSKLSEEETAIDFLQFPRQSLQFTAGDCDDLSVLYAALLEAVGVETAFITVPGHIFAAFALQSGPQQARSGFSKPDNLIFEGDTVWVPVEITLCQESFEKAWTEGAKQWREHHARSQTGFYPNRDSWQIYQPVGFREGGELLELPDRQAVTAAFKKSMEAHVEREIYPQIANLQARLEQSRNKDKDRNELGVVYARYGLYGRALEIFQEIVAQNEYLPALINLGNIHFLREEFEKALSYYQRAVKVNERNPVALLGVARCSHELENYGTVAKIYKELQSIDPDLAMRFAYLDLRGEEASRAAAAAGTRQTVLWEGEGK